MSRTLRRNSVALTLGKQYTPGRYLAKELLPLMERQQIGKPQFWRSSSLHRHGFAPSDGCLAVPVAEVSFISMTFKFKHCLTASSSTSPCRPEAMQPSYSENS